MNVLPSVWDLIIPNFNITTFIGVILIIIGILLWKLSNNSTNLRKIFPHYKFSVRPLSILSLLLGIILIWVFSILEDLVKTSGGMMIIFGTVIVIIVGIFLFTGDKKK